MAAEEPVATVSAFLTVGRCFMQEPTVNNKAIDRGLPACLIAAG